MLIDLVIAGKGALVVGQGEEPERKALKLMDAEANVTFLGRGFSERLRTLASRNPSRIILVPAGPTPAMVKRTVERVSPHVVFIWTGDRGLDERLSKAARTARSRVPLVCVVDDPRLNDFNMPAIGRRGDIRIGVSTGGLSPAMASILRRKLEKLITPEEVLQVRLQGYIRNASKRRLKEASSRKALAYKVIRDEGIGAMLRKKDYAGAKRLAEGMLKEALASSAQSSSQERGDAKRHA